MQTVAQMKLVTLGSACLNFAKNSSCRLLCINDLLIHHIIFSTTLLRNWFYWNQQPQSIQDSLVPNLNTKYALCYLVLSKLAKWACTKWKLFFLLENWFPFIFYLWFMLYILVLKICFKYVKQFIQLSQMSKMSNSRSRTQYFNLNLVPFYSVPSNLGKK